MTAVRPWQSGGAAAPTGSPLQRPPRRDFLLAPAPVGATCHRLRQLDVEAETVARPLLPYEPPREYVEGEPPPGFDYAYVPPQVANGMIQRSAAEKAWIHKLCEGGVGRLDDHVGAVLSTLRELGRYDDAVLVFTADHGEEFWEHGGQGHGHTLYNEIVNVPLFVKAPGLGSGRRVAAQISSVRIAPILLEAADVRGYAASLWQDGTAAARCVPTARWWWT